MTNKCKKYGFVCNYATKHGNCTVYNCKYASLIVKLDRLCNNSKKAVENECTRNNCHTDQNVILSATTNKYDTKEIIFQLNCVKEHLKFISKTTDNSVDFDIEVLDGCISQLEEMWRKD